MEKEKMGRFWGHIVVSRYL